MLYVAEVSAERHVYWVKDGAKAFTVEALPGRCGCRKDACAHRRAVERYLGRKLPLGPLSTCPCCDGEGKVDPTVTRDWPHPGTVTCPTCGGSGRLIEAEAKALRDRYFRRETTLRQRQAIWHAMGGDTEIAPKTRVWPRKLEDGTWDV